jgi:hypothetical protein
MATIAETEDGGFVLVDDSDDCMDCSAPNPNPVWWCYDHKLFACAQCIAEKHAECEREGA